MSNSNRENSGAKIAFGAMIVAIVGFVAGLLTAPKSGKATRDDIKDSALKAKTEAEKALKKLYSELHARIVEVKQQGESLNGKARDEFDRVLDNASDAKEKVRQVISAIHEGDADDPDLRKALKDAKSAIKNLEKYVKN